MGVSSLMVARNLPRYADAFRYTGSGAAQTIKSRYFAPDMVMLKSRQSATPCNVYDVVRGNLNRVRTHENNGPSVVAGGLSFASDGFTLGNDTDINAFTGVANDNIAWAFKRQAGFFDIQTYIGDGATSKLVNHNLGVAPKLMIVKNLSAAQDFLVYHASAPGTPQNNASSLNTNLAFSASAAWNNTAPTSTQFTVGNNTLLNVSGKQYVVYLFGELSGYSRFGSYTGNGNVVGPVVSGFGFTPKILLIKEATATGSWMMYDRARQGAEYWQLALNSNIAEFSGANTEIQSGGFQPKTTSSDVNTTSQTYLYCAWA